MIPALPGIDITTFFRGVQLYRTYNLSNEVFRQFWLESGHKIDEKAFGVWIT